MVSQATRASEHERAVADANPTPTTLEFALGYLRRGWYSIPTCWTDDQGRCKCPGRHTGKNEIGKAPWLKDWQNMRLSEYALERMFGAYPQANLGILPGPSGLIDIAPDSPEWLAEFVRLGLPPTAHYTSGGGEAHEHHIYRLPPGCPFHKINRSGEYDIQVSSQSVAPPSRHRSGRFYQWIVSPEEMDELPIAPEWAAAMLKEAVAGKSRTGHSANGVDRADGPPVRLATDPLERWYGRLFRQKDDGSPERSGSLYDIGQDLARAGVIDPKLIADLLRDRDKVLGFEKYIDRKDGDVRYEELADLVVQRAEEDRQNRWDTSGWTARTVEGDGKSNGVSSVLTVIPPEDWPAPDAIFGPPPAPGLSLDLIPREIANVAQDVAERQQAPVDFVVWPLLVSAAGLIGRCAGIRPRAFDDWTERPALWVAQIGPPSSLKTPAQEEGTRGLRRQQERDHEVYVRALADWKADCMAAKQADPKHPDLPPQPTERRCWTADVTIEKLAILLTPEVSRGLTVYRDELAGLILDLDKYHQKGGDRQFYLQAYTGGPYTVDRVQRESLFIPDLLVNVVGGIQPEVARAIFGGGPDDGFAARFLSIWPETDSTWHRVDRWPNRTARQAMDAVSDRMSAADWQTELALDDFKPTPFCRLASEGQQLFDQWHEGIMTSLRAGQYQGRLEGRVGKYPGLAARLILVYHLIEWAAGRSPQAAIVTADTVASVLELVDEYVLPMEQRVYSAYAVPTDADGGRRIARWLQAATPAPAQFTAREILRRDWAGLQDAAAVAAALDWLVTRQWLREAEPEKRPGRPSNVYLVNPRLEPHHG